jgi:hypothetical protein
LLSVGRIGCPLRNLSLSKSRQSKTSTSSTDCGHGFHNTKRLAHYHYWPRNKENQRRYTQEGGGKQAAVTPAPTT